MDLLIEYLLCYSSAYGLGLISGLCLASLYYHFMESNQND